MRFVTGDILTSEAEAVVNTVNCVGVMGRGLALQFKRAFPGNFAAYKKACDAGEVVPGRMFVYETRDLAGPRWIVNFPTKRHWRGKSTIADIDEGLLSLRTELLDRDIRSVAIPPLGSGLGGLNWSDVRPRIERALQDLQGVDVIIYEPGGGPTTSRGRRASNVPRMTTGRAALVGLVDRYLAGLMDTEVTLLEVHKMMYFMQVAGEPLKLRFQHAAYGPYAENLRHVLRAVEGHFLTGYLDGGDQPDKPLQLVPGAVDDARAVLESQPETRARFQRVAEVVAGFESPFGLELLATVHAVAERRLLSEDDTVQAVREWGPQKSKFRDEHIRAARQHLLELGWLASAASAADDLDASRRSDGAPRPAS